ncbi:MAG: LTA synthase family protein [Clostridiales bacterium]|nr:LTA synthase family protein [Clostridiales bacterium]
MKRISKNTLRQIFDNKIIMYALYAVLAVIIAEILNCGSIVQGFTYVIRCPLAFLSAFFIVYITYLLTLLVPRRLGAFLLMCGIWLGLSIANYVLLTFRVNPLSAVDFKILISVIGIINVYLSPIQIILIIAVIAAAVALAVLAMIHFPPHKPRFKTVIPAILLSVCLSVIFVFASKQAYSRDMSDLNLPEAYKQYGFVYCFAVNTADRGIARPDEYSSRSIRDILDLIQRDTHTGEHEERPNIIMVQLESFFDVSEIRGLETSKDATPFFRELKEKYPSGYLEVPVCGAGTVNTEFEILCGMSLSSFGLGEYPYESILKEKTCESVSYRLGDDGYTCHAVHNHTGTFYDRYKVMKNLGFDTFTPVEYMSDVERNELGWACDKILTGEIIGAMDSTEGVDFVYAVSVQPHGKYVREDGEWGDISVSGKFDEDILNGYKYYVNQLYETDRFIGELIASISERGEDAVIVFFGDHLPSLSLTEEDVESGSVYKTEYVIWSSFDMGIDNCDMEAYRLASYLTGALGVGNGVVSDFHNKMYGKENYRELLDELSYDLIFGEKYAYGGEFPYEVPDMQFGWHDITCESAYIKGNILYVNGNGFTESSVVYVDGRPKETIYIDSTLIVCTNVKEAEKIEVAQTAGNGTVFGKIELPLYEPLINGRS